MTVANPVLSPLNDFVIRAFIERVDPVTGVVSPLVSGSLTGFLATSADPTATTADPTWSVAGVYIGGANNFPDGTWQFEIDGTVLTVAACNAAFLTLQKAYFIVVKTGSIRKACTVTYKPISVATVVEA